ncbi:hypothetical protein BGX31_003106 [Mortierella sp. GBA43]|nr:hypothetical protein BGX31_003106 [Mortierella sp. GBA43]
MLLSCYIYSNFVPSVMPVYVRYIVILILAILNVVVTEKNLNGFIKDTTNQHGDPKTECIYTGDLCTTPSNTIAAAGILMFAVSLDIFVRWGSYVNQLSK